MSVQDKPATISAWIFDWDGVFVDSEMWKAWSYGLGICEVWEDFERLEASRFDRVLPAASDPFLRVCGRFVGRSREEYLEGLIEHYDLCGYDFNNWLVQVLRGWRQNAPDRIAQIEREQARAGAAEGSPILPRDVLFELRRPWFDKVVQRIEPIESNITLPEASARLDTRRAGDAHAGRSRAQADGAVRHPGGTVREADLRRRKRRDQGADVRTHGTSAWRPAGAMCSYRGYGHRGHRCARAARAPDGSGMGLVIACPTAMTEVQPFTAADLIVRTGLSALLALMG